MRRLQIFTWVLVRAKESPFNCNLGHFSFVQRRKEVGSYSGLHVRENISSKAANSPAKI
ncbi:uncharacterized protein BT62DRAFT_929612 [Guyanagaster necrorhizus]|uniref:Uncharacterized protein n=1 Tax=Guyanagaster necrorhizus TaxID=856835 RepID=A0A9P7VX14_9AGAR|nr:uncharacterized protein BT62DRAFT_929612 [Guyanagaster necrorhizus MCA 3950]KAG7448524.1 hypothetical protein BT62DRAFT_929612 [Guyanagaster necrorhizus MCA 3950]